MPITGRHGITFSAHVHEIAPCSLDTTSNSVQQHASVLIFVQFFLPGWWEVANMAGVARDSVDYNDTVCLRHYKGTRCPKGGKVEGLFIAVFSPGQILTLSLRIFLSGVDYQSLRWFFYKRNIFTDISYSNLYAFVMLSSVYYTVLCVRLLFPGFKWTS
jgi:hypothetical protein